MPALICPHRRGIDRLAQTLHNRVHQGRIDDKGRRQQHMITAFAIDRPAHRIDHKATRHCFAFHACMKLEFCVEGLLAGSIGDEFEGLEQTASTYIADKGMIAESFVKPARETRSLHRYVRQ